MADPNASTTDMNSTVQYGSIVPRAHSKIMRAIYIPGKLYLDMALLCEVRPAILARESITHTF